MASGTEIFRLFGSIFIDTSEAEKSLSKTDSKVKKLQESLGKAVTGAAKMAAGVAASVAGAGAAVFAFADNVASVGDTIDKQSQKLGLSAKGYQEWEAVLGHCGASIDSFKGGMKTLTKAITTSSKDQVAAFQAVGLSMDQVASMSREEVLNAVITGLQGMDESAERTSIATTLLGKAAGELGPLLNTSAEDTAAMKQAVNELGGVMSNEGVAASAAFKDALQDLTTIGTGFKNAMGTMVLPYVTEAMTALTDGFRKDGIAGMQRAAADVVLGFTAKFAEKIPDIAAQATSAAQNFAAYLQDNMPLIVECGGQIITNLANGIFNAFPSIAEAGIQTVAALVTEIWAHADSLLTTGADLLGKLIGGLISVLGDLIDAADEIVSAIVTKIMSTDWVQVGKDIVSGIARGIQNALPNLTGPLNKLSYKLNHALGKNGYAEYDTYEDWAKANGISTGSSGSGKYQQGSQKNESYWKQYGAKMAKQYGIGGGDSAGSSNGSGGATHTTTGSSGSQKAITKTVIKSLTDSATATSKNALGIVTTTAQTLTETIKDSTGKVYDRVTKTITETGKETVNGVVKDYKTVTTYVNGVAQKTVKTYEDASKTLANTFTAVSQKTVAGVTTAIQKVTETYQDGSEHVKETHTETGERIVDGVAQTYTKVTTYVDGFVDKVEESAQEIEHTYKATQERIEQHLSEAQTETNKGFFALVKNAASSIKSKDWKGLAKNVAQAIWGEVDQDQRDIIAGWANDAAAAINEAYAGGGLKAALQAIADIFNEGIIPGAENATKGVKSFAKIIEDLSKSGGVGKQLADVATQLGNVGDAAMGVLGNIGTFMGTGAANIGASIAGLAADVGGIGGTILTALSGIFSQVGSLILSNPEIAAIVAIAVGLVALGTAIWAKFGKKKEDSTQTATTSTALSYKDLQDAYWYGNERSNAGYISRTDPYTYADGSTPPTNQQALQRQVEKQSSVLERILKKIDNLKIDMDGETVGRIVTPHVNTNLGQLQALAERGN
nr:MAG TPA: tail tape measure protein [Caudoviricetes sp.]